MQSKVVERDRLPGIGDIALRYGMTARALRFYEARGLIRPVRTGHARHYTPRDEHRIAMILKGKQLGFSLGEIAVMLGPIDEGNGPDDLRLTCDQVSQQIAQLEEQHRVIDRALGELRRRLYLMTEFGEPDEARAAV
jgi:DNA-binding transcriptional MerR regulator